MLFISNNQNVGCIISAFIFFGLFHFFGCTTANRGHLKHSGEVTQAFETYHVFPAHRYYYLNQENNPYAVAALQNPYMIRDNLWTEFDPKSDKLEKVVELVKRFPVNYSYPYGSYLKDRQGNQVGYWYSSLRMTGINIDNESKKVSIHTEAPWLRDEDWGFETGVGVGSGRRGGGIRFGF